MSDQAHPTNAATVAEVLFRLVLDCADVNRRVDEALDELPFEPSLVLGGGKAGAVMARRVAARFPHVPGVVAVPHGEGGAAGSLELVEAGHPLPDEGSVAVVDRAELLLARHRGPLLFLLSGGASAMLGAPLGGMGLDTLRRLYTILLEAGLDIEQMNVVRRHLTRWGGGKLAALADRRAQAIVVSDVRGDRLETIGSGPLAGDVTRWKDVARVLAAAGAAHPLPPEVSQLCGKALLGEVAETVRPDDSCLASVSHRIVLSSDLVVKAVRERLGLDVEAALSYGDGDVGEVAARWSEVLRGGAGVWLSGGEPAVHLRGKGRGGRNQHLSLLVARAMSDIDDWLFLSVATDGVDGNSANAGAWVDPTVGRLQGLDAAIAGFDSASFCERHGLAFRSGPTGTNVADIQIGVRGGRALREALSSLRGSD